MGRLVRLVTSGLLLLTMGVCAGLLGIHRLEVVDIVVLVACGIVLVAWGTGYVRKFGRAGPLDDEERKVAEAECGPGVPVPSSQDRGSPEPWR